MLGDAAVVGGWQEGVEVGEGAVEAGRALHLVLSEAVVGPDLTAEIRFNVNFKKSLIRGKSSFFQSKEIF